MWCKGCLTAAIVVLAGAAVAVSVGLLNLGRFLDASEDIQGVDAIVVMGGEGARYTRTQHAVELYEEGLAPVVVFSGGTLLDAGLDCSSTGMSLDAAGKLGLPAEAVVISDQAQSTYDEAGNLAELAEVHGWNSLVLVTDRFHTRRSVQTVRSTMPGQTIVASAPDDSRYDAGRWWGNEHGVVYAINEVLKLAFYWKEYGIRPFG